MFSCGKCSEGFKFEQNLNHHEKKSGNFMTATSNSNSNENQKKTSFVICADRNQIIDMILMTSRQIQTTYSKFFYIVS